MTDESKDGLNINRKQNQQFRVNLLLIKVYKIYVFGLLVVAKHYEISKAKTYVDEMGFKPCKSFIIT